MLLSVLSTIAIWPMGPAPAHQATIPVDTGAVIAFVGDAGLVSVRGNSDATTLSLGDKLTVRSDGWLVTQTFSLTRARTDDSVTAASLRASLRSDRAITATLAGYALADFDRDRFAGVSSRYSPSLGLTLVVVSDSSNLLRIEAGVGYTWQNAVSINSSREFAAGRGAITYHRRITGKSAFDQTFEALPNLKNRRDLRINSKSALTAPIAGGIALKASYVIHYAGLPEPGFEKVDRIFTTGIQLTL